MDLRKRAMRYRQLFATGMEHAQFSERAPSFLDDEVPKVLASPLPEIAPVP